MSDNLAVTIPTALPTELTSAPPERLDAPAWLRFNRAGFGGIENGLHYPRDITLHEDQTRFKKHSAAHIMAIINNLVLGLIAKSDFSFVPSARR